MKSICNTHTQHNSPLSLGLFLKGTKACLPYSNLKLRLEVTEARRILFSYTMISTLQRAGKKRPHEYVLPVQNVIFVWTAAKHEQSHIENFGNRSMFHLDFQSEAHKKNMI